MFMPMFMLELHPCILIDSHLSAYMGIDLASFIAGWDFLE